jgi:predicted flap endonuclease-1-like 5' DNA nuclease
VTGFITEEATMAERPTLISDGIFYGAFSVLLAGVFAIGIGFAYTVIYGGSLVGGFMIAGIVVVIGGWILARFAAGGDLPPPNSVRINPPKAPTVPRSREAERRAEAATPTLPDRLPSAHEAGVAVGAAAKSAAESVKGAAETARERVAGALSSSETEENSAAADEGARPPALSTPREDEGGGDDLLAIKGIGPKLMSTLNGMGYYHYDQIAAWTPEQVAWVDSNVDGVNGRASRDDWVGQARAIVAGEDPPAS